MVMNRWIISLLIGIVSISGLNLLNQTSIENISLTHEVFKVTSLQFNPYSNPSEWVDRILGPKSVFYSKENVFSEKALTNDETNQRFKSFSDHFTLPSAALFPSCSIEILSYGLLDQSYPISKAARRKEPSTGHGSLGVKVKDKYMNIDCYYRGLYESWRLDSKLTNIIYWPIVVYCPIINGTGCKQLQAHSFQNPRKPLTFTLDIYLKTMKWTANFKGRIGSLLTPKLEPTSIYMPTQLKKSHENKKYFNPKIGVCLAVPYISIDNEKQRANRAIMIDWIRYYTNLNFMVMIYDRDGANYDNIFNNERFILPHSVLETNLAYYNYTLNGILDPSTKGMQYDNSELLLIQGKVKPRVIDKDEIKLRRFRFESQGYDKTLTLTHCRFEAKAVHGIDTVIVADFDEFLYCPQGGPSAGSQAKYIKDYVSYNRRMNIDQIAFPQRFISNRTKSAKACIIDQVKANQSLFNCFAPYYFYMGGHSIKSIHLGHKCPLTGYHQSCPTEITPRAYDCLCANKNLRHILPWRGAEASNEDRECGMVHLSMNDANYIKFKYSNFEFGNESNEIGRIIDFQ